MFKFFKKFFGGKKDDENLALEELKKREKIKKEILSSASPEVLIDDNEHVQPDDVGLSPANDPELEKNSLPNEKVEVVEVTEDEDSKHSVSKPVFEMTTANLLYKIQISERIKVVKKEALLRLNLGKKDTDELEHSFEEYLKLWKKYSYSHGEEDTKKAAAIRAAIEPVMERGGKILKKKRELEVLDKKLKKMSFDKWFEESIILTKTVNKKDVFTSKDIWEIYTKETYKKTIYEKFIESMGKKGIQMKILDDDIFYFNISKKSEVYKREKLRRQ